ncbi:hypothetical protein [Thalassoglobus sp.]|uniref:hypothetical protein n=1 Tax=Thalassoglobus sp. TaxID=2795869 RepID=UPI003AA951A8
MKNLWRLSLQLARASAWLLEPFALPFAREEGISLEPVRKPLEQSLSSTFEKAISSFRISSSKMLFATRQNLQTNSKDALVIVIIRKNLLQQPRITDQHARGVRACWFVRLLSGYSTTVACLM